MATWMRFPVQEITLWVMNHALDIRAAHALSYWDSTIIAAASAQGCGQIFSEDLAHGRQVEGVMVVNPFRD